MSHVELNTSQTLFLAHYFLQLCPINRCVYNVFIGLRWQHFKPMSLRILADYKLRIDHLNSK